MTHKATIEVVKPHEVRMRLTIEASAETFLAVREALADYQSKHGYRHNVAEFAGAIRSAVDLVDARFVGLSEPEETP